MGRMAGCERAQKGFSLAESGALIFPSFGSVARTGMRALKFSADL